MEFLPDFLLPLPQRVVRGIGYLLFIDADSVVIIGDSVADSVADSVVRRRLSRRLVADQSSTSRRLGFCASYEKKKYRAINTYEFMVSAGAPDI